MALIVPSKKIIKMSMVIYNHAHSIEIDENNYMSQADFIFYLEISLMKLSISSSLIPPSLRYDFASEV